MAGAGAPMPPADLVDLGAIRGAYGVKGWARVAPYDAEAEVLLSCQRWWLRAAGKIEEVTLTQVRRHAHVLLAKWPGCDTPEAAESWNGAAVAVGRSEFPPLPEGRFYWVDLIGLSVVNRAGETMGLVRGLNNNGAQDLLDVAAADASFLIPLVPAYVERIDPAQGVIHVDWQRDWS
jgi:16S rRNA processing protein RimM